MKNFKNWFIWDLFRSGVVTVFVLFFGFFASIAYFSERQKNNEGVHIMKEDVIYVRPVGFEEKEANDSSNLK